MKQIDDLITERIDKWLWAVRIYKTRSDAAEACKSNRVLVNDVLAKPSREIKKGDLITIKKMPVTYTYKVIGLIKNRQSAKNITDFVENITPQEEIDKLLIANKTVFIKRDRGAGRPTKKERRVLDQLMSDFNELADN